VSTRQCIAPATLIYPFDGDFIRPIPIDQFLHALEDAAQALVNALAEAITYRR
jgi:hypothetical protein